MRTIDVTPARQDLNRLTSAIGTLARRAVGQACSEEKFLSRSVIQMLDRDQTSTSPFRLMALAIAGACGLQPDDAVPVSAISRHWWVGAETLNGTCQLV
jgi:hypothetical protein